MRYPSTLPIRRVLRGTDWSRKRFDPQIYPISPAIENLLSEPTWSVSSLLPPSHSTPSTTNADTPRTSPTKTDTASTQDEITPAKLHHLLKLSALPLPKSPAEESRMLKTLHSQIHFVKSIQSVDTRGIDPLITIRDETPEAIEEATITLEKMMPYLKLEEKVGKNGTVRRRDVARTEEEDMAERSTWEVDVGNLGVGSAERRRGRWFYVRRGGERNAGASNSVQEVESEGENVPVEKKEEERSEP